MRYDFESGLLTNAAGEIQLNESQDAVARETLIAAAPLWVKFTGGSR